MKINNLLKGVVLSSVFVLGVLVNQASASLIPNLILGTATAGTDAVQVTVYGADPNVSVQLFHTTAGAYTSSNIGTTNASGYLLTVVNSVSSGITASSPVYVVVNGQQSATQSWPNYTNNGSLPLSQNNILIQAGQTGTVSASVSAALSVSNNSNSMVATVNINGNQIIINGINPGTSNITICGLGIGCGTIAVTVQSNNSNSPAGLSFSQTILTMASGQSQPITITGSGNYYISSNSNSGAVTTSLSGSTLTVNAVAAGNSSISVCTSSNNSTSCGIVNVTVTSSNTTTNTTNNTGDNAISFSPSSANITVGQRQSVAILGTGNYFVSTNSSADSVTANINGSNIDLTGVKFGGANIKICQLLGGCGNLYVYVAPADAVGASVNTQVSGAPVLSSIAISSDNANGFVGAGSALTVTFSANQIINTPSVSVAGNRLIAAGSGNGPYVARYTVTGNEGKPISLEVSFTNTSGSAGQAYMSIGALATSNLVVPNVGSNSGVTFTQYLRAGSTGVEVTALQKLLNRLGLYTGPVTGKYGALTAEAVKKFQAKNKISQLGEVGPATRALLNKSI